MDVSFRLSPEDVSAIAAAVVSQLAASSPPPDEKTEKKKLLYTEREAAAALGVSAFSLKHWRQQGLIESFTVTKPILYSWENIQAAAKWMASRSGDSN